MLRPSNGRRLRRVALGIGFWLAVCSLSLHDVDKDNRHLIYAYLLLQKADVFLLAVLTVDWENRRLSDNF